MGTTTAPTTTKNDAKTMVKVTLDDFPEFDGRQSSWTTYRKEVKATMLLLQMNDLLEVKTDTEKDDHKDKLLKENAQNNKSFHAILSKKTAKGTAASLVDKHEEEGDGALAWADLVEFYDFGGDKEVRSSDLMNELLNIKLLYDTPGGFNKYANTFETKANELEKVPFKLEDSFKKTLFLRNILDRDYTAVKDNCTNKTYREAVNALRTKARDLGRVDQKGPTRGNNNKRTRNKNRRMHNKNNNYDESSDEDSDDEHKTQRVRRKKKPYDFPPEVWEKMTWENRKWIKDQMKRDKKEDYGKQYSDKDDAEKDADESPNKDNEKEETNSTISRKNNMNVKTGNEDRPQSIFRDPTKVRKTGS